MSKVKARAYCKSRGFGDFVHLHCPNGTNENNWLWFHHPWQPFQEKPAWQDAETGENHTYTDPLPGLITGVTRGRDFNNFDYWCDDDLYQSMDYFNWVWTQPKMMTNNNRVFANNIYLHLQHPGWYDTPKCDTQGFTELDDDGNVVEYKGCEGEGPYNVEDGTAGEPFDFHFICEMNCEMAEKERYVDRSGCDVECEDECYSGACRCKDVLKHAKKDGSCQYMTGTDLIHFLNYTSAQSGGKGCPYYPDSWYTGDYSEATHDNIFKRKKRDTSSKTWVEQVDEINNDASIPYNYYQMFEQEHPAEGACRQNPENCPFTLEFKSSVLDENESVLITSPEDFENQLRSNPQARRTNHFGTHTNCPEGTFFTMDQWETTSNQGFNQGFNSPEVVAQVQGNRNLAGLFERMTEDCAGDPLEGVTETNGGWWRPKNPFPGKEQSMYHMIDLSTNMTYRALDLKNTFFFYHFGSFRVLFWFSNF